MMMLSSVLESKPTEEIRLKNKSTLLIKRFKKRLCNLKPLLIFPADTFAAENFLKMFISVGSQSRLSRFFEAFAKLLPIFLELTKNSQRID